MDFSQFLSDLLSTLIGVGLAICGAIWLDRKGNARQRESKSSEKLKRAQRVIRLLRDELKTDYDALTKIDDNILSTFNQMKIELWQAFSDGGELQSIDDPELLASMSNAYALIKQFTFLYDHFFQMKFFPSSGGNTETSRVLVNYTIGRKNDALEAVKKALDQIAIKIPKDSINAAA